MHPQILHPTNLETAVVAIFPVEEVQRQSKILKQEAKEEKQSLATAERELAGIRKVHSVAIKVHPSRPGVVHISS